MRYSGVAYFVGTHTRGEDIYETRTRLSVFVCSYYGNCRITIALPVSPETPNCFLGVVAGGWLISAVARIWQCYCAICDDDFMPRQ